MAKIGISIDENRHAQRNLGGAGKRIQKFSDSDTSSCDNEDIHIYDERGMKRV